MRKILYLLLIFSIIHCGKGNDAMKREGDDVVYFENDDSEMNAAIEEARKTLPEFQKALLSENPDYTDFAIKQRFDNADGNGEHIWLSDITFNNGKYTGVVQNVPINIPNVHLGDSLEINENNISDWMYYDKNKIVGAYTIRVMRKNISEKERKQMDEEQGISYE